MNRGATLRATLFGSVATVALLATPAAAEAEVNVGGYIKADVMYNLDQDLGNTFAASAITPDPIPTEDGTVSMHVKQSRFWLKTSTKTEAGTLKTHFEADFFTGDGNEVFSNSAHLRARHVYGQLGNLLVGQTWTNFMSLHSYADTVDFFGPTGMPFIRAPQVRYTFNSGDNLMVAVSIENPEISGRTDNSTNNLGTFSSEGGGTADGEGLVDSAAAGSMGKDTLPDFVGRVKYSSDKITGVLSAVIRPGMEIEENLAAAGAAAGESETGWGVHGSLGVTVGPAYVFANATYGEGIGRYLITGFANDLIVDTVNGTVTAPAMLGISPGIDISWNDKLRSVLVWGHADNSDAASAGDIDTIDTFHANVWYQATDNARYGFEAMYGTLDLVGGLSGDATRLQFGAQYSF